MFFLNSLKFLSQRKGLLYVGATISRNIGISSIGVCPRAGPVFQQAPFFQTAYAAQQSAKVVHCDDQQGLMAGCLMQGYRYQQHLP